MLYYIELMTLLALIPKERYNPQLIFNYLIYYSIRLY